MSEIDAILVLLGNVATDDPEGEKVYHSLLNEREERIIIFSKEDTALVNALQRRAAVVVQKSIREGFGLTVTEAIWKGTPVIVGMWVVSRSRSSMAKMVFWFHLLRRLLNISSAW